MYADQVIYNYASSRISDSLLPMIYRYDYELEERWESASDVPLRLRVSKNYEEVKEEQGVLADRSWRRATLRQMSGASTTATVTD